MKSMFRNACFLLCVVPVVVSAQEIAMPTAEPVASIGELPTKQGMMFFDSRLFDARLSKEMEGGKDRIEIDVPGKVSLSAIPDRLDKWITRIGENGSVEVREGPSRTRSLFSLIPMLFSAVSLYNEERTLEPAKHYDASILYKRDASGDTVIDRIVLNRKK